MRILAMHTMGHDTGIAFFDNARLDFSIETERLTRVKHDHRINIALDYYLANGPINPTDIDLVVLSTNIRNDVIKIDNIQEVKQYIELGNLHYLTQCELFGKKYECLVVAHEASHAALACHYANNNEPCLVLVNEGHGTFSRNSLFIHEKHTLKLVDTDFLPWYATGFGWSAMGYALGYGKSPSVAGKIMAIGGYGKSNPRIKEVLLSIDPMIHYKSNDVQKLGLDRLKEMTNFTNSWQQASELIFEFQRLFTDVVADTVKDWQSKTAINQIALGGGCALNLPLNTYIRDNLCRTVAVSPACNDSGQAIGAGIYALKYYLKTFPENFNAWINGKSEDDKTYEQVINNSGLDLRPIDLGWLAKKLESGAVIAYFDQVSAIGPRSLGERSILANPAIAGMRKLVSEKLKQREWFRPLAPIMRLESFKKLFPDKEPSPHMLFNYIVNKDSLREATHIDGTARIQTLEDNGINTQLYQLLYEFEQISGVPALINTSLNSREKAIAYRAQDVIHDFLDSEIDIFVFGNKIGVRN